MTKKLACLGPSGTYSDLAAREYLDCLAVTSEVVYFKTIYEVLRSVENGLVDVAIVPVENLLEGSINETLDFLAESKILNIEAEITIDIHHNLIGLKGASLSNIKAVYSHPQPLAQCRNYIRLHLSGSEVVPTLSTAEAVHLVLQNKDTSSVAIASEHTAQNSSLVILSKNIGDASNNKTRFLIVSTEADKSGGDKISLVFTIEKDSAGGLYGILEEFALRNINLTKIESRPSRDIMGSYIFFIDFEGNTCKKETKDAISGIAKKTNSFRILGEYKEIKNACT